MQKELKVTLRLTNGEELIEKVNWKHGNDYAKHGLIDPNNPEGDDKFTEVDIKDRYFRENTIGNFFAFGGAFYNLKYIGMIKIEVWKE